MKKVLKASRLRSLVAAGIIVATMAASAWSPSLKAQNYPVKPVTIVVSNPPYIGESEPALKALLAEPRGALVSGREGLTAIRSILSTAADRCRRMLLLEHGATQGEAVRSLFTAAGFRDVRTERDLAGLDRVTWGRLC